MNLTLQELQSEAAATGFPPETLDKVIRLVGLLNAFQRHPYLRDRVVLKGGTALNLFIFDLPRLSVDIDLNYVGAVDREGMQAERRQIEQAIIVLGIGCPFQKTPHGLGRVFHSPLTDTPS